MFESFKRQMLRRVRNLWETLPHWLGMTWELFTSPFRWLGQALALIGSILVKWWTSRQWRRLLWGIPSILVLGICAYFIVKSTATTTSELAGTYVLAGRSATKTEQWKSATLFFERALELGVRDREALFDLVVAADKSGDESRKLAVLERLAPDDQATYAPAHLWKATQALSVSPVSHEKLLEAERHLRLAIQLDSTNVNAHAILGEIYFQRGFMEGAVNHLEYASKTIARYQLLHAKACILTKRRFKAESSAKLAQQLASKAVGENPNNHESRLEYGEALLILEQYDAAIKTLQEGIRLKPDEPRFRVKIADTYLEWARSILDKPGDVSGQRSQAFQLTAAAMQFNPEDPKVFGQMMELVQLNDAAAEQAREFLRDNIATGRAVGISHLLLGTSLEQAGDLPQAGFHLEQAFSLMPEGPIVANNLAWHLVNLDPPEVDRAMKLISLVIDKYPDVPAYVDTRAHVYLKMKEWKKAITDFQISMREFANEPAVHAGLAEAYENLGMTELAVRHRKIEEQLIANRGTSGAQIPESATPP